MKRIHLVLAGALLAIGSATAVQAQSSPAPQAQGGARGGRGRMMQMLMQGITLTADQQKQYDSIVAKYQGQMQAAMSDANGDRDAARAKMRDLMGKESDEIKAILTGDQRKTFDKNVADMEARRRSMQGGGNPPGSR